MPRLLSTKSILPANIDINARFKRSTETNQQIYVNIDFDRLVCEGYDLKYFKMISYNLTENSIHTDIFKNSNNETIFSNKILNENAGFDIENINNNNDILISDISLSNESTKKLIEKYSTKNVLSNSLTINLKNYSFNFNLNLYFKVSNIDKNDNYNFMIYCYNSKNELIEKKIFQNVNISSLSKEKQRDYNEIANILYNVGKDLFSISAPEIDLQKREIFLRLGSPLRLYRDNIEKIFSKITIEEITSKGGTSRSFIEIEVEKFNNTNNENTSVVFRKKLDKNEIPIKYILHGALITGQFLNIEISNLKIKRNSNFNFNEKIKIDITGVESGITQESTGNKYLTIEIKLNSTFSNLSINEQYDPYVSRILVNNIEVNLNQFTINSLENPDQQEFKLNSIKNKIIKLNALRINNLANLLSFPVKVVLSNLNEGKIDNFAFEKIITTTQNLNTVSFNKVLSNENLNFSNQYTLEKYRYFFDLSNLDLMSMTAVNASSSASTASRYVTLNLDKVLSDENKNILLNDINVNNFYLIVKKNISFSNANISFFEIIDVSESNNNIYDFSFFDDQNFRNFNDDPNKYNESISRKEIEFEAKVMSLPLEYFSKSLNDYQVKLKIKDIIKLNRNNGNIPLQSEIDQVHDKLKQLNTNGLVNLSQSTIQLLYDLFALNITYAKTTKTLITKQSRVNDITKNAQFNISLRNPNIKINSKNNLEFTIEITSSIEENEIRIREILQEIILARIFSGFYYKEENSTQPNISLEELYKKNIPSFFQPWLSNNSNAIVNEINSTYKAEIIRKQNSLHEINIKIDLNKCNNLYHFLIMIANRKDKISSLQNLSNNLYQKIELREITKSYIDSAGNNIYLNVKIENTNSIFLKYPLVSAL